MIGQIEFNLRPPFISPRLGRSFERKHAMSAGQAHANEFAVFAETSLGIVKKRIGLERAGLGHAKAQCAEGLPDSCKFTRETQLDFDFELQSDTLIHCAGLCQISKTMQRSPMNSIV
jgi:hypothetical protein